MNIILFEEQELDGGRVVLHDRRAVHIHKVLRATIGDRVRVGLVNGPMGSGRVASVVKGRPTRVELDVELGEIPTHQPEIDIILALPRPIMLRRILGQVAALGIGTLFIIQANRVEKSFWDSGLLEEGEYLEHLRHGLEQAVDTRLPQVRIFRKFKPFVEDFLPLVKDHYRFRILAHPYGTATLAGYLGPGEGRIVVAVGPEGGWVDFEVERFEAQGFRSCSLGDRILKVDTAVVALHARISAIRELLGRSAA
ncbi:16S rRNA (uracil(1498)-N(3))-methyltransferase [Desulfoprunum benzoelyticum]|uniref:Ribosomal RNA small subunit methyltransferase E n=1 Tax=Desulfoprunum benzoelyticum TaxID=1506996 RepID=A0A840UUB3_9BACT|nr:16S rRNA (uracil(1498)-N(3))-methyltransferase [Desulfoprunum benzoelyticum]MBB5349382.1 RsmE family RNA methyltransferase [Desulfoprunum benzoelyticum]MBM9531044.1 16S rRNA (uracil(1498)-N(3))-methyltransferase [Desulfoprunum benzoelyticum]